MNKKKQSKKFKFKSYRIYGIYDFQENKLVCVDLKLDTLQFEYDIGNYDETRFDIVSFDVWLT